MQNEDTTPDWIYSNIKDAAGQAEKVYFIYLGSILFVLISLSTIPDKALYLINYPLKLPVIQSEVPVEIFVWFAPLLLVFIYIGLQVALYKVHELHQKVEFIPKEERENRVFPFSLYNSLVYPESGIFGTIQTLFAELTTFYSIVFVCLTAFCVTLKGREWIKESLGFAITCFAFILATYYQRRFREINNSQNNNKYTNQINAFIWGILSFCPWFISLMHLTNIDGNFLSETFPCYSVSIAIGLLGFIFYQILRQKKITRWHYMFAFLCVVIIGFVGFNLFHSKLDFKSFVEQNIFLVGPLLFLIISFLILFLQLEAGGPLIRGGHPLIVIVSILAAFIYAIQNYKKYFSLIQKYFHFIKTYFSVIVNYFIGLLIIVVVLSSGLKIGTFKFQPYEYIYHPFNLFIQDVKFTDRFRYGKNLNWSRAIIRNIEITDFQGKINFDHSTIKGSFSASCKGCSFKDTNMSFVQFTDTNLRDADLTKANLKKANFVKANLGGATLTNADLTGANLTDVSDLTAEQLCEAATFWNIKLNKKLLKEVRNKPNCKEKLVFPELIGIWSDIIAIDSIKEQEDLSDADLTSFDWLSDKSVFCRIQISIKGAKLSDNLKEYIQNKCPEKLK